MSVQTLKFHWLGFWEWWRGEITALLPESIQVLFSGGRPVRLHYLEDTLRIVNHGNSGEEVAQNYLRELDWQDPDQRRLLNSASEITLCLGRKNYLIKRVTLPIEAEENLREVLAFEMDRHTPFNAQQVYYDYLVNQRDRHNRVLDISLVLAPIDKLKDALSQLEEHRIRINGIAPCDEREPGINGVNLLPSGQRSKPIKRYRLVNGFLMLLLLVLLGLQLALPPYQKSHLSDSLEVTRSQYQEQANAVGALRDEVTAAERENRFLENKKLETHQVLEVLQELTLILPDDTWVSQFEIRDGKVHLYGQSVASAVLIPLIESSKLFRNVSFRSPVTQNSKNNTERFHISADLVSPQGEG
ncbi:MAG: PilN domain-containing protein [Candidatus Thiodiazotropha sp.]